jgi:hypothetical protein
MRCQPWPSRVVSLYVRACLVTLACAVAVTFPSGAIAASCAPPGNSGVDQYFETVPGAGCNKSAIPGSGGGGQGGHGSGLSPSTSRQLASQGPAGRAVAQLVATTGPGAAGSSGATGKPGTKPGSAGNAIPSGNGSNPISALLRPLVHGTGAGGTGLLLPLILVATLAAALGAAAWGVIRRRRLSA